MASETFICKRLIVTAGPRSRTRGTILAHILGTGWGRPRL